MNSGLMLLACARWLNCYQNPTFTEVDIDGGRADMIVVSRARYITEVEIKCSASDWRKDADKDKWKKPRPHIARFYYAIPAELQPKVGLFMPNLPVAGAGILAVRGGHAKEIVPAKRFKAQPVKQEWIDGWYRCHYARYWFQRLHRIRRVEDLKRERQGVWWEVQHMIEKGASLDAIKQACAARLDAH